MEFLCNLFCNIEDYLSIKRQNLVYIIVPNYDFKRYPECVIFVSKNKKLAYKMLDYLNNNLKDKEILDQFNHHAKNTEKKDNYDQILSDNVPFKCMPYFRTILEKIYNDINEKSETPINLIYDFLAVETMLNQTRTQEESSKINSEFWNPKTLKEIRTKFNNQLII
jgi:hypothetical protein